MSPIGRVFVVLNLILAGTFVGFSGTFLQRQHHWKAAYEKLDTETQGQIKNLTSDVERTRGDLGTMTNSKNKIEQELGTASNERDQARDEVKRLEAKNSSLDADVKRLAAGIEGVKQSAETATASAKDAFDKSLVAINEKNEAIRAKDAATGENRDLKNQIAALNETIQNKDLSIADLKTEGGRLKLLVDVAKAKGFVENMAVPPLAGTVANVTGKLCTIMVTENSTNADITPGTSFAIYDASGYKAEARVTDVDTEHKAAFCTLDIKSGDVKPGDKASTKF
jgi:uncharacterized phage infection (PIP) family protein YhgE